MCKAVGVSGLLWPYVEVCVVCGDADSFAMAFRVAQAGQAVLPFYTCRVVCATCRIVYISARLVKSTGV